MSSWSRRLRVNVPSPNPDRVSYARFIPREELGDVQTWSPEGFGLPPLQRARAPAEAAPPAPPEPSAEELAQRLAAARQAGYQDGYRDGMAALESFKKTHAQQRGAELAAVARALDAEFDGLHEELSGTVARVATQLARQVLRAELSIAPAVVAQVAAQAVEALLHSARHVTVAVHADDLPLVAAGAREVLESRGARVVAQPGIERGGCRVESSAGSIDARIGERWAQAMAAMGADEPWHEPADTGAAA